MSRTYRIYALVDPRNSQIFYVGKTLKKPRIRLEEHINDNKGMIPRQERVREIQKSSKEDIQLVVLQDDISTDKMAFTREVFWIEMLSMVGTKLTNASIDFDGVHFLSDHYLSTLPDKVPPESVEQEIPIDEVPYKSASEHWQIDIELASQPNEFVITDFNTDEFYHFEDCETFDPIRKEWLEKTDFDFQQKRADNQLAGRLINHGFPITKDEIREAQKRHRQGASLEQLESYFQRSRMSISDMLERYLPQRLTIKEALTNPLDKLLLCENCNCFWRIDQISVHCPDCNGICKTVDKPKPRKKRVSKLKVFGGAISMAEKGQVSAIIACTSKKKAAEIINISLAQFNQNWRESVDTNELSISTQSPGVILITNGNAPSGFTPIDVELNGESVDA